MCMLEFFPARRKRQLVTVYEWGSVVTSRQIVSCCEMTKRLEQRYCMKFCQKLGDTQPFTRSNRLSGMMPWVIQPLQGHADRFLFTPRGWCIMSTHHNAQPLPRSISRRSFIAFVIVCDANGLTCGQRQLGSCNTIMRPPIIRIWFRRSWPNTVLPWFVRLPTPATWLPVIFGYFPKLKIPLEEARFEWREDIMHNAMTQLNSIPKDAFHKCFQQWQRSSHCWKHFWNASFGMMFSWAVMFQKCFQQWQDRWDKCVIYQGDYFEGD
jgi:hypothetical protein